MNKTLDKIRCAKCKAEKYPTEFSDSERDKVCIDCKRAAKKKNS